MVNWELQVFNKFLAVWSWLNGEVIESANLFGLCSERFEKGFIALGNRN